MKLDGNSFALLEDDKKGRGALVLTKLGQILRLGGVITNARFLLLVRLSKPVRELFVEPDPILPIDIQAIMG